MPAYNNVGDFFMSKEDFKLFVRTKPELIKYVKEKNASWQKLYEIYELYGEDCSIWNEYLNESTKLTSSFNDIFNTIKNIDLNKVQSGIESIQNTISMLQNFGSSNVNTNSSEPRYKYQKMDD